MANPTQKYCPQCGRIWPITALTCPCGHGFRQLPNQRGSRVAVVVLSVGLLATVGLAITGWQYEDQKRQADKAAFEKELHARNEEAAAKAFTTFSNRVMDQMAQQQQQQTDGQWQPRANDPSGQ